jgi:hypothetical protein
MTLKEFEEWCVQHWLEDAWNPNLGVVVSQMEKVDGLKDIADEYNKALAILATSQHKVEDVFSIALRNGYEF